MVMHLSHNRVALQGDADKVDVLRRMLAEAQQGAWLLWADFDTVFANRAFSFPFAQYEAEGRHVVLGGTLSEVLNGNGYSEQTPAEVPAAVCHEIAGAASHPVLT